MAFMIMPIHIGHDTTIGLDECFELDVVPEIQFMRWKDREMTEENNALPTPCGIVKLPFEPGQLLIAHRTVVCLGMQSPLVVQLVKHGHGLSILGTGLWPGVQTDLIPIQNDKPPPLP
jgi:hypothetical protein